MVLSWTAFLLTHSVVVVVVVNVRGVVVVDSGCRWMRDVWEVVEAVEGVVVVDV
jgi:hypothetical protein